jgi:hypothetical protein
MPPTRSTRSASSKSTRSLSDPDEVTVLVFRDNDTSRSFQVSLGWITRLGFAIGAVVVLAMIAGFFALKFYRVARKSDPVRVIGLEQRITDLQTANQGLETKLAAAAKGQPLASSAGNTSVPVNTLPVPTVTVTAIPGAAAGGSILFGALPTATRDLSADSGKLPITVSPARVSFGNSGRTLKVSFNIQYGGPAHGSQQGRIIILARGPNTLFAYPEGVLGRAGASSLVAPQQGEYFSVSRFREVKADFPDLRGAANGQILDVEILIMSLEDQLLFYQKIPVTKTAAAPKPPVAAPKPPVAAAAPAAPPAADSPAAPAESPIAAPSLAKKVAKPKVITPATPPAAAPPADASELIEPGVDQ